MANPVPYGDPHSQFISPHTHVHSEQHQRPGAPFVQHPDGLAGLRGPPAPFQPGPRQIMYPPPSLHPPSFPPHPPNFPRLPPNPPLPPNAPLPPNFNYTAPPPFPMNNVAQPQVQPIRIPPPIVGQGTVPQHNHFFNDNTQTHASSRDRDDPNFYTKFISQSNESSESDKNKQDGKKRVLEWLQKIGKAKPQPVHKQENKEQSIKFNINDYLVSLQNLGDLIKKMSSQVEHLESALSTSDKSSWTKDCSDFEETKGKYLVIENLLENQVVSHAAKKLKRIRQKRARISRVKQTRREESLKVEEARHIRDKEISHWQKQIEEEMKEEKLKKERKINMDRTLAEVTKKIHDADRLIETMTAVEKLRLIRRDAAEKRGDSDLGESRQNIAQKIADMKRLVKGQLEVYKEEEQTLREAIKSELEESNKKEKQMQLEKDEVEKMEKERNFHEMLFGHLSEAAVSDPLYQYQEFYKQAQKSLPALLQIRQDWDRYITVDDSGSAIPSSWVLPCHPSSDAWASALMQD